MAAQYLTNSFMGSAYSLQADKHSNHKGLCLKPSRDGGLLWSLVPSPENPGKYNICTTYKDKPKCLDIWNSNESDRTRVCLAKPGYYSGQTWSLIPNGDGFYKLSNDWTGPGWFLDTYSDSYEAFMSQGDASGQLWIIQGPEAGGWAPQQQQQTGYWPPQPQQPGNWNQQMPQAGYAPMPPQQDNQGHHFPGQLAGGLAAGFVAGRAWQKFT